MGLPPFALIMVLKGTRSNVGGFEWRYYNGPTIAVNGILLSIINY